VRFAVAQAAPVAGDLPANLQQAQDLVGAADGAGADLVVFPELHVSGYLDERLALRADDNRLAALSASAHAGVVLGFPEQDGGARFNSAALYVSGQLRHVHRKLILPSELWPVRRTRPVCGRPDLQRVRYPGGARRHPLVRGRCANRVGHPRGRRREGARGERATRRRRSPGCSARTPTQCYGPGQRAGDHVFELGGDLEPRPGWRSARLSTIAPSTAATTSAASRSARASE
jgi:hypothetical protein